MSSCVQNAHCEIQLRYLLKCLLLVSYLEMYFILVWNIFLSLQVADLHGELVHWTVKLLLELTKSATDKERDRKQDFTVKLYDKAEKEGKDVSSLSNCMSILKV